MKLVASLFVLVITLFPLSAQDSLVHAEGQVLNAETREPVTAARIVYQSLPYGNKVGVLHQTTSYSFPMFDGEKYSITVEASGFAPVKYMLDPAEANENGKVIKDIELSTGAPMLF